MPSASTSSRANHGAASVEEAVHVVTINVVGLTGIAVDTSHPQPASASAAPPPTPPNPKQMKAVVAVLRDQQTHSVTSLSRGLVPSRASAAGSENNNTMQQQLPHHKKYIAVWANDRARSKPQQRGNSNSNSNKTPATAASFEASIPVPPTTTKQQRQNHQPPHRNFELIVGLTHSASSKATPIGAASLPLAEAARLCGQGHNSGGGRVLLDLPVYNYASLTMDPFAQPAAACSVLESSSEEEEHERDSGAVPHNREDNAPPAKKKKHRRRLSFSRRKKNHNHSNSNHSDNNSITSSASASSVAAAASIANTTTTRTMTREDVGTLAVVNQLQKLHALGYNYFMDPTRDAAVLRVELELHQKEDNVEMTNANTMMDDDARPAPAPPHGGVAGGCFGSSNSNNKKKNDHRSSRSSHNSIDKNSGSSSSKQPRVVLLDTTEEQAIETATASPTTTTTARANRDNAAQVQQQQQQQQHADIMEPSIERVLSSEDDDKNKQQQQQKKHRKKEKKAAPPPPTPKQKQQKQQPGTPKKRAKSPPSSSSSSTPEKIKQFRVRIVDQTLMDYNYNEVNPDAVSASGTTAAAATDKDNRGHNNNNKLLVLEHAIERILSSPEPSLDKTSNSNNNDEIEVKKLSAPALPTDEPVKVYAPSSSSSGPRRRLSSSSAPKPSGPKSVAASTIVSAPTTPERAAKTKPSSPPPKLQPASTKTTTTTTTTKTSDKTSLNDVDIGREHLTIKPLTSNSSTARSKISVVSNALTVPVKNSPKASKSAAAMSKANNNNQSEAAGVKPSKMSSSSKVSKSEAAAGISKSVKSKSDSTNFLQRNKLKPPPGSGGKSLRKVRGQQKAPSMTKPAASSGSVAATNSTAPDSDSSSPSKTLAGNSNGPQRKTASTKGTISSTTKAVSEGKTVASSSNDPQRKTTSKKGTFPSSTTKPMGGVAAAAAVAPEPLAEKSEIRAEDVTSPVDRMKMNFERRFSGQSSKRVDAAAVVTEAATAAQSQTQTLLAKQPASTEKPQQQQQKANNSAGANISNPVPRFTSRGDLQFKQNFEKEEINSIWTEDPSLKSRSKAQSCNAPSRAAAVAQRLFGSVHLEPCSAGCMDKEYEEDFTVGSVTMQTEEGTFATVRTRRETIVDDLADLGLLVGRMCQQQGFGRVVDFDDDDTMTTAYGGRGGLPRETSSIDGTDDADTFNQRKPRWLKSLNAEALRSFGERRGFAWARATDEAYEDGEEDTSHYTEGTSASDTDATLEDEDNQDGTIATEEGTEVDIAAVAQAPQPVQSIVLKSTPSIRSNKSKQTNKTPPQQQPTLVKSIVNSSASIRSNKSKQTNKTPQQQPPLVKSIVNSTASIRSNKSKRSDKTPQQQQPPPPPPQQQQQQNKTPPQQQQQQQNKSPPQQQQQNKRPPQQKQPPPFEEVLISGSSSESNSTTELLLLGPVPPKDAASRTSADKTKKTTATDDESPKNVMQTPSVDDESPKNVMQTPSVDGNVKSFTQSLVDMVANAITPVPDSQDGADTLNVPSVLEADFENGSVGELTATTLEMQVEMAEFRKQLEKLQKDAREANGGQIHLSEITAAAEAALAKQQAKGGGHAV